QTTAASAGAEDGTHRWFGGDCGKERQLAQSNLLSFYLNATANRYCFWVPASGSARTKRTATTPTRTTRIARITRNKGGYWLLIPNWRARLNQAKGFTQRSDGVKSYRSSVSTCESFKRPSLP